MVDFGVFDSILDAAFVVDGDGRVVYCNDPAATFVGSSQRRLMGKAMIADLFTVAVDNVFPFRAGSVGYDAPSAFIETAFTVARDGRAGTCQLAVRPCGDAHWLFFVRDVSLEEALHGKYRSELAQKEDYARNLEKLVEARTAELRRVNQTLGAILNSLGQGFFTFDAGLTCGTVFTKACETVLEGTPPGRPVVDVLGLKPAEHAQFTEWSEALFSELLPFDDLKTFGPAKYPHSGGQHVTLEYYPIRREDQSLGDVVVVATDRTAEVEAQLALEAERQYAAMIVAFTKNKDQFLRFLASLSARVEALRRLRPVDRAAVNELYRALHTIEGEAGAFALSELRLAARECQRTLEPVRSGATADDQFLTRFDATLARIKTVLDQFLLDNHDVIQLPGAAVARTVELPVHDIQALLDETRHLTGGAGLAARYAERFLTEPIERRLGYFNGVITSVAEKLGRRVYPIAISGGATRVRPEPLEPIFSALTHAFRNAVDHGLEDPVEREAVGKDPRGRIGVDVRADEQWLTLTIQDDGRGIDPAVIRPKLAEKFPGEDVTHLSDDEVIQATCRPGFSSREAVGEFSGRGVGLDALNEEVVKLGGRLTVRSKLGQGTAIELRLPRGPGVVSAPKAA